MIDIGVAVTWIAISALSAKGLAALARAASAPESETEPLSLDAALTHDWYPIETLLHPLGERP